MAMGMEARPAAAVVEGEMADGGVGAATERPLDERA